MQPTINLNWSPFLKHQKRFFDWESKERITIEAMLGGYGSGKTSGAARKFLKRAFAAAWRPAYGSRVPQAVVMAPTSRILKKATIPALEELLPNDIIIKRRGAPHPMWQLCNGLEINFVSGDAGFEGENVCLFWIDEISHETFARAPEKFVNYTARIRDPHAPKMSMICSGLPESGWVRETFDVTGNNRQTLLCGTQDNPHIPRETLEAILASCPAGYEDAYIRGGWMSPPDAVFSQWDSDKHLTEKAGDLRRPVHIGLDVGNHGAIIFAQRIPLTARNVIGQRSDTTGVLLVDQIITRDESVAQMCHRIKIGTKWELDPRESTICVDPTIRRDELKAIRDYFPSIRIVKRDKSHELYPIEAGVRIMQTALRDAHGNTRLYVHKGLAQLKHGIVDAIQTARRHKISQRVVKDDSRDHALDACRYVVQELLRPVKPQAAIIGQR